MVSALRKWWNGDYANRLAETQQRIDAAPDGSWIQVDSDLLSHVKPTDDSGLYQKITLDHDVKEMKRALVIHRDSLASGKVRTIEVGPTCEKCGQAGIAYRHCGLTRILICSHVWASLDELLLQQLEKYYADPHISYLPLLWNSGPLRIAGCYVDSVECGRNLKMHLRMRYCWFD